MPPKKASSSSDTTKAEKKQAKLKVDEIDLKILRRLREDSRLAFTKLAENLKIPDTTVHFRVKKLKDLGVIKKFTISISPEKLNYNILSLVKIRIGGHIVPDISNKRLKELTESLKNMNNIYFLACSETDNSLYALVYSHNAEELNKMLKDIQSVDFTEFNVWTLSKIIKGEDINFEL